jgi:hypothetical protein
MITKRDLRDSYAQLMRDDLRDDRSGRIILAAYRKWKCDIASSGDEKPCREEIIDIAVEIRDSRKTINN